MSNCDHSSSKLFTALEVGAVRLSHRVVLAPLTRNRGTPSQTFERTWYPDALHILYYSQRATPGGLLITEAVPVSLLASGSLGIPGMFTPEQREGWSRVSSAVHNKDGFIFCQLWHQGRTTHSRLSGSRPWSSFSIPIQGNSHRAKGFEPVPYEAPHEMTLDEIVQVQNEYVTAAKMAIEECKFDGIEVHAANGYLLDQFHHSNINHRSDEYGISIENRCRFTITLAQKLCDAVGSDRVAFRLAPFGLFNETRGEEREPQWVYLCSELSKLSIAYIHLIEPRFDELQSESDKLASLHSTPNLHDISLAPYQKAIKSPTKCIVAGGYDGDNCWEGIEKGEYDAIAFGRYFVSNEDLVGRLRTGKPLYRCDRSTFYGPFPDNALGYTIHPHREFADQTDKGQSQLFKMINGGIVDSAIPAAKG
ncbi:hypothetical protein JAAARDRAFT_155650 [Jaapia argillacea MUCL 33604]|uniref:NADH:flavin oxidoreductase/NADH oxidase N-terminal domain-containing protein n=1 Tax=Jaapia argillacea MUCL 33604 TaxID=933084 RepID=A0A067Q3D2_9AGAM|nr:hypothetical protein JAAARDRAFT_155650 [Jaapia argillacea MUCL 33604]